MSLISPLLQIPPKQSFGAVAAVGSKQQLFLQATHHQSRSLLQIFNLAASLELPGSLVSSGSSTFSTNSADSSVVYRPQFWMVDAGSNFGSFGPQQPSSILLGRHLIDISDPAHLQKSPSRHLTDISEQTSVERPSRHVTGFSNRLGRALGRFF